MTTLFASLVPPRLLGARCTSCATVVFPALDGCPRCTGTSFEPAELADHGTLWTYTVQAFEPKAPYVPPAGGFVPFGVGYVDLGDVLVEGRLVGEEFAIGDVVRLVTVDLPTGTTYAFERAS